MVTGIIEATNPTVELALKRAQFITGAALMLVTSAAWPNTAFERDAPKAAHPSI